MSSSGDRERVVGSAATGCLTASRDFGASAAAARAPDRLRPPRRPSCARATPRVSCLRVAVADDLAVPQDGGAVADAPAPLRAGARCRGSTPPRERSRSSVTNSSSASCGVSTEVGSSMMMSCGACSRQRTISMRWRSPTDRSATTGVRIERQAVLSARPCVILVGRSRERRRVGERQRDVLGDRQRLEQREMLEHHADAELARRGRAGDRDRLRPSSGFRPRSAAASRRAS